MTIGVGIFIFIIGCLVGYLMCTTSWLKAMSDDMTKIEIELAKLKVDLEVGDEKID